MSYAGQTANHKVPECSLIEDKPCWEQHIDTNKEAWQGDVNTYYCRQEGAIIVLPHMKPLQFDFQR